LKTQFNPPLLVFLTFKEDLIVQVESPVDFQALKRHGVDIIDHMLTQELDGYFTMLNGLTYEELVKDFWIRAEVYDREVAKMEEFDKIEGDESLKGKTRADMGLEEFKRTEIRSAVMGISVTITQDIIARAARCSNEGKFQWNMSKTSSWVKTVKKVFHKDRPTNKFFDMQKEHRVLQKLVLDCFLQRGGGTVTMSVDHNVFLYFLNNFEKVNLPRYIFNHTCWALKESQGKKERRQVPYGRLSSEIFHQSGMLKTLRSIGVVSDKDLDTSIGKIINGRKLKYMQIMKKATVLKTNLKESDVLSDLMVDFPPISKEDNPEVLAAYVVSHYEDTGNIIIDNSIPPTMDGVPLKIAKKRKSKTDK